MDTTDRKQYWNRSYLEYWKSRVDESADPGNQSGIVHGDAKTEGDEVYERVFAEHQPHAGSILDVGCAWGRMFPMLKNIGLRITGVDISQAMIDQAKKDWGSDPAIAQLIETEAESMPLPDNYFDNVACLAVFDALYQNRALQEFFRVLKMDKLLYLTGKNDLYPIDDEQAYLAEAGARRKNHPNYFTDTPTMLEQIQQHGHEIVATYFFPRRGNFAEFRAVSAMPREYYEYFVVIRKRAGYRPFEAFSSDFSKTFRKRAETESTT